MKAKHLPLDQLARIFRAINGDKEAQAVVTLEEAGQFHPAETFSEFIEINKLPVYESVLR